MPEIELPDKLHKVLTTNARFVVVVGGRSSGKSEGIARILLMLAQTEQADILCGREYQNSIDDSVHKLLKGLITKLGVNGFTTTDKKIVCTTGGGFRFKGFARNPENVKSAQDFKYSWIEEAQSISQQSIDDLLPTIRSAGSKLFFTANPQSSADPFSQRFVVPYINKLRETGFYEDDLHLIIMLNWRDNPWHGELDRQRLWDKKHLTRAKYLHIWEGDFNDSVESPLVLAEWFDACVDSHVKLGFKPQGIRYSAHDPADEGNDAKGYGHRHGSVITDLQEMRNGNINDGGDWATGLAIQHRADAFIWDCDGMGIGLGRQVDQAFDGHHTRPIIFKGSEGVDLPNAVYHASQQIEGVKTNKESFKNKRAQYYFALRDKIYRTYRAIEHNEYHDPDELISFSSDIKGLKTLRSELCRLPIKPNANGLFELYTKDVMRTKFKMQSPNLADTVMMLCKTPSSPLLNTQFIRPQPIRPMGCGARM